MPHLTFPALLAPALLLTGCAFAPGLASRQATSTEVGTIRTGTPQRTGPREHLVPLAFTGGTWMHHSARCFSHARATVTGREIRLTVHTTLCTGRAAATPAVRIRDLTATEYNLLYIDPDGTAHPAGKLRP